MFRLKRRNGWMMGRSPLASRATYIERAMEASASGVVRGVVGGGDAEDGDGRGHALTVRMVCVCLNIATIFTPSFRGGLQKIVRVFLKEHCEKRKYDKEDPSL